MTPRRQAQATPREAVSTRSAHRVSPQSSQGGEWRQNQARRVPGDWPVCHGNAQGQRVRAAGKVLRGSLRTGDHHRKGEVQVSRGSLSFKSIQGKVYGYFVGVLLEIFFN